MSNFNICKKVIKKVSVKKNICISLQNIIDQIGNLININVLLFSSIMNISYTCFQYKLKKCIMFLQCEKVLSVMINIHYEFLGSNSFIRKYIIQTLYSFSFERISTSWHINF